MPIHRAHTCDTEKPPPGKQAAAGSPGGSGDEVGDLLGGEFGLGGVVHRHADEMGAPVDEQIHVPGVTTMLWGTPAGAGRPRSWRRVRQSTTVGMPMDTTGIPRVCRESSARSLPTPAPGAMPQSAIWTVRPSRERSRAAKASMASTAEAPISLATVRINAGGLDAGLPEDSRASTATGRNFRNSCSRPATWRVASTQRQSGAPGHRG